MLSCFYGVTVIYNLLMLYPFSQLNLFECFIISIASQIIHSRVPDLITSVLWLSVGKMFCYLSSFRFYIFGSSYVLVHLPIVLFVQYISPAWRCSISSRRLQSYVTLCRNLVINIRWSSRQLSRSIIYYIFSIL